MDIYGEYIHLARLALSGRRDDVRALLRRTVRSADKRRPDFQEQLKSVLSKVSDDDPPSARRAQVAGGNARGDATSFLIRDSGRIPQPTWAPEVRRSLEEIVAEREKIEALRAAHVHPTRSLLLVGPPGVGKTLAARSLTQSLGRNLFTVDLASIMSSYLGRTGANLRTVLSEAADDESVLFLDEFDSVAKRRNDDGDVGELKRLVNVLLQSIDSWPDSGLLVAATNHPELLDRAIWRRFDRVIEFPMPDSKEVHNFLCGKIKYAGLSLAEDMLTASSIGLSGKSFADIELWLNDCVRASIVGEQPLETVVAERLSKLFVGKSPSQRAEFAIALIDSGVSQRRAAELSALSRDTIRKYMRNR